MFASSLKGFLMLLWSDTRRHTLLHSTASSSDYTGGIHCNQSYQYSVGATDSLMARVVHLAEITPSSAVATNTIHASRYACNTYNMLTRPVVCSGDQISLCIVKFTTREALMRRELMHVVKGFISLFTMHVTA